MSLDKEKGPTVRKSETALNLAVAFGRRLVHSIDIGADEAIQT